MRYVGSTLRAAYKQPEPSSPPWVQKVIFLEQTDSEPSSHGAPVFAN